MKKFALAFAAASFFSTGAMAQAYVSGAAGVSRLNIDCEGAARCDTSGTAAKLTAGYQFGNGFAAEIGYMSFGEAKAADPGMSAKVKADGLAVGAAYRAALANDWGMSVRLGVINMKTRISASVDGLGSGSDSDTNAKPYFGFGVDYALSKNFKVEAGADFSRAEYDGEKASARAFTVGVRFDF